MAEEKQTQIDDFVSPNTDDMQVLNYLLQNIRGISSVSGDPLELSLSDNEA